MEESSENKPPENGALEPEPPVARMEPSEPRRPEVPGWSPQGRTPQPGYSPQKARSTSPILWIVMLLGLFALAGSLLLNLILGMAVAAQGMGSASSGNFVEKKVSGTAKDRVLVVDVDGVISRGGAVLFSPASDSVTAVKNRLAVARNDKRIKAVILRVNSPGGTVTASDEIYKEIEDFKAKTGTPVVSLMGETAASGGYYVSMACDKVVAHEATLTGSIGVIMQFLNYKGLFDKHGLRWVTITPADADLKGIGGADREMTQAEKDVLQSMVEEMYELFLVRVGKGRKNLTPEKIRELADGRPYTGAQAFKAGLIDALGDLETAISEARKIKSFDADPTIVTLNNISPFGGLFGMSSQADPASMSAADIAGALRASAAPRFYYMYH